MSNARLGELERRLSNTIRPGTVLEADYAKARLRVTMGDNTSAWLPWLTSRAGEDRTWHAPEVGEQVIVIAPGGELSAGYVMPGGVYKNDYPANADKAEISRTTYKDGAVIEYDREAHAHRIQLPEGKAIVKVGDDAQTEITPDKITAKVGSDAKTEITASKITHTLGSSSKIEVTSGSVKITVGGTSLEISSSGITINGNITQTGNYDQTGLMKSNGITLSTHTHGGVMPGTSITAVPNP
jgi:phage baseplate assembly protein V